MTGGDLKQGSLRSVILGLLGVVFIAIVAIWWMRPSSKGPAEIFQSGMDAFEKHDGAALAEAVELLDGYPDYSDHALLLRAAKAVRGQSPDVALLELGKMQTVLELREPAMMITGEALYQMGQFNSAGRIFSLVAQEHPGYADAHRWLAAIAYDLGAFDAALAELEIVIQREPNDYRAYHLQGQMMMDLERFSGAQEAFIKSIANQPPEDVRSELIIKLARVQLKQRDYTGAKETLNAAKPSAIACVLKGECERSLGRPEVARQLIDEALQRDPRCAEALAISGLLHLDAGQPERASEALRQALEIDPHDYESRYQLAQALRELGQTAAADEQAKLSAQTVDLRTELAKKTEEAIRAPMDPEVRIQLAELCDKLGKPELATMWRNAAANCRPIPTPPPDSAK